MYKSITRRKSLGGLNKTWPCLDSSAPCQQPGALSTTSQPERADAWLVPILVFFSFLRSLCGLLLPPRDCWLFIYHLPHTHFKVSFLLSLWGVWHLLGDVSCLFSHPCLPSMWWKDRRCHHPGERLAFCFMYRSVSGGDINWFSFQDPTRLQWNLPCEADFRNANE